jgi:hypothetical protein
MKWAGGAAGTLGGGERHAGLTAAQVADGGSAAGHGHAGPTVAQVAGGCGHWQRGHPQRGPGG